MKGFLTSLVGLYPEEFRRQFGDELGEMLERDYAAAAARGPLALIWFVVSSGLDLGWSAAAERFRPTVLVQAQVYAPFTEEHAMKSGFQEWMRDLKLAARSLRRSPAFAVIAIGTLGLAIGADAAMFSVIDKVLLDPLPFAQPNQLVHVGATAPGTDLPPEFGISQEMFAHYRERSKLIEAIGLGSAWGTSTFRAGDRAERVRMAWPENGIYKTLGVRPILGRLPRAEEEDRVALLSYGGWQSWFGGDPSVIGKSYFVSDGMKEIVGIMPADFIYPSEGVVLWVGGEILADRIPPNARNRFMGPAVARLKPGVTPDDLARELTALSKEVPERFGSTPRFADVMSKHRAVVRSLEQQALGNIAQPLWVVFAAVGIVLLIAWANVANLFMVRTEGRQRELVVRRAVGAARLQLIRLQMSEAIVIAGLAAIAAVGIAWVGVPALVRASPPGIPRMGDVAFTSMTLVYTLVIAFLSAIACGLVPAIRASSPDLSRLRESGRSSTRRQHIGRNGLVVAQTAMALVLLIGSGLLMRSFVKLTRVDPGYSTQDIFTFQFAPEFPRDMSGIAVARFHQDFMNRMRALPGTELVGVINNIPLDEGTGLNPLRTDEMAADPNAAKRINTNFAGGDVFQAMGIKLLSGEVFDGRDLESQRRKVIVSKSAASTLWPTATNVVGRRLQFASGDTNWHTVIGVVNDVLQDDFREQPRATAYFPLVGPDTNSWGIGTPAYVIKSKRAEVLAPEVRAIVKEVAPMAPMYRVYTMETLARNSVTQLRFTMLTLGIVSSLALILGAVGLYGVLSYVVAERTKEIGVRMALGAEASRVQRMVVAQGARVVGLGVVIGVGVALLTTKALTTLLFGVQPLDIGTFVAMSVSMVAVGLLASYMPARRASLVDPMESLRGD